MRAFGGPRHGLHELRRRAGAGVRALTCSALKPQGLPPARLGELAKDFARAGIDYIKDDHGLADQSIPFTESVRLTDAAGGRARLSLFQAFHHTGPVSFWTSLRAGAGDGWPLLKLLDELLP